MNETHRFEYQDSGELKRVAIEHVTVPAPEPVWSLAGIADDDQPQYRLPEKQWKCGECDAVIDTGRLCEKCWDHIVAPLPPGHGSVSPLRASEPEPQFQHYGIDLGVIAYQESREWSGGSWRFRPTIYSMTEPPNVLGIWTSDPVDLDVRVMVNGSPLLQTKLFPVFSPVMPLQFENLCDWDREWRNIRQVGCFEVEVKSKHQASYRIIVGLGMR